MPLLVTSAAGANGDGYGALLTFGLDGIASGVFVEDRRIADPRGLAVDPTHELLFLNSGADRILAIDRQGRVVRDTGPIKGLNPGGGSFGADGRYHVGLRTAIAIMAFPTSLDATGALVRVRRAASPSIPRIDDGREIIETGHKEPI